MKLTPAASTWISSSPGPGVGESRSTSWSTSGPPSLSAATARISCSDLRYDSDGRVSPASVNDRIQPGAGQHHPPGQAERVDEIPEPHLRAEPEYQREADGQPPRGGPGVPQRPDDQREGDRQAS